MKSTLYKILSIAMALIVLFSTFSFTVDQHYCGDVLVNFSVFGKAESCGMEIQQALFSEKCNLTKKQCCDDETLSIAGQEDLSLSLENLSFERYSIMATIADGYLNIFEGLQENITPFNHYPPPSLVKDILILDQTFLI